MKIKTKQTTEIEVEIELPYFFKLPTGSCHAIFEDKTVRVWNDTVSYEEIPSDALLNESGIVQITAKEFTRAFDERIEQLQSLKSHFFTNKQ